MAVAKFYLSPFEGLGKEGTGFSKKSEAFCVNLQDGVPAHVKCRFDSIF